MRSRLAARSAQVLLTAAVSATALTTAATGTAFAGTEEGAAHAAHKGVGQFCGTNDLTFSLTEETQAGGYYLVTAKAKPGITCYLEGIAPTASFGSTPETKVSPVERAATDTIKLSGSTAAYTGINPKSVGTEVGTDSRRLTLAITNFEIEPVTLALPGTVQVNQAIATNWHADPADAVPFLVQPCTTGDLRLSLTEKTQAGGYYLVTAKAKPGITCSLESIAPNASFGSTPETRVSPSEPPAAYATIEVSDSLPAYTGISPKSVGTDEGTDSRRLSVDITGHETRPVILGLPETVSVNQPIATNWQADATDAVPFPG